MDAEDDELARALRARRRDMVRADAEEDEALAALAHLRARTLDDLAREAVNRGDELSVRAGTRVWQGTAIDAGASWLCVHNGAQTIDIRLEAITLLTVVRTVRDGGGPLGTGARSWRARMAERELTGEVVEVGLVDGQSLGGRLVAAAGDHLLIDARTGRSVAPTAAIAWVRSAPR